MRVDRIDMRVFIEGVLFPRVSSVTVNCSANEVATATVTVPPAVGIQFESFVRARVHVFYSDVDIRSRMSEDQWPVLFEGEVTGDGFSKSPMGRNLVFRCSGYHTYFQQVLLSYYDPQAGDITQAVNAGPVTMFLGNEAIKLDLGVAGADLKSRIITRFQEDSGRSYTSTLGSMFGESLQANHFFQQADSKLKLSARFLAPKDDKVDQLIKRERLIMLLNQDVTSVSGRQSIMDTLKDVLSVMRYQLLVNPQPRLVPKVSEQKLSPTEVPLTADRRRVKEALVQEGVKDDLARDIAEQVADSMSLDQITDLVTKAFAYSQLGNKSVDAAVDIVVSVVLDMKAKGLATGHGTEGEKEQYQSVTPVLAQFLTVPDTRFAAVPRCNVIFPGHQTALALERDLLAEPTRMFVGATVKTLPVNRVYMVPTDIGVSAVAPATSTAAAVNAAGFSAPVIGDFYITSGYGMRFSPTHKKNMFHEGVDIGSNLGSATEIRAVNAGKVIRSRVSESSGEHVYIDHGQGVVSKYLHMVHGSLTVAEGATVSAGQVLGRMGKTGRVTGVHLHFEYWVGGKSRDPMSVITATSEARGTTPMGRLKFTGRSEPRAKDVVSEPMVESPAVTIIDKLRDPGGKFNHWQFLTPEEEVRGIVPVFDSELARAHTAFDLGDGFDAYMQSMAQSEFLWHRYQTRSMPAVDMPFNPQPVAGFPGLVVDNHRSIIGLVTGVSHVIAVGGGSGTATTTVSFAAPRFWDEGDPYYWRQGAKADENRNFPVYYLDGLVPTNSASGYALDQEWPEGQGLYGDENRDVDAMYRLLLGCPAIPYEYGSDKHVATGLEVAVNLAVDGGVGDESRSRRAIVGHYQRLNPHDAGEFVRKFTSRESVNERQLMTEVLGAAADKLSGTEYTGAAFRPEIQDLVRKFNTALGSGVGQRG